MNSPRSLQFTIFADYHQFYLWDRKVTQQAPEDISPQDIKNGLKIAPSVAVIFTVRNSEVPVELQILNREPSLDQSHYRHIVEASIELPTGTLQIHECTGGPRGEIQVQPGTYQILSMISGPEDEELYSIRL